jgi:hypothetical protein
MHGAENLDGAVTRFTASSTGSYRLLFLTAKKRERRRNLKGRGQHSLGSLPRIPWLFWLLKFRLLSRFFAVKSNLAATLRSPDNLGRHLP